MKKVGIALVSMGIMIWLLSALVFFADCPKNEEGVYRGLPVFQESDNLVGQTYHLQNYEPVYLAAHDPLTDIFAKISIGGFVMIISGCFVLLLLV